LPTIIVLTDKSCTMPNLPAHPQTYNFNLQADAQGRHPVAALSNLFTPLTIGGQASSIYTFPGFVASEPGLMSTLIIPKGFERIVRGSNNGARTITIFDAHDTDQALSIFLTKTQLGIQNELIHTPNDNPNLNQGTGSHGCVILRMFSDENIGNVLFKFAGDIYNIEPTERQTTSTPDPGATPSPPFVPIAGGDTTATSEPSFEAMIKRMSSPPDGWVMALALLPNLCWVYVAFDSLNAYDAFVAEVLDAQQAPEGNDKQWVDIGIPIWNEALRCFVSVPGDDPVVVH
jgi:hypothetical protein